MMSYYSVFFLSLGELSSPSTSESSIAGDSLTAWPGGSYKPPRSLPFEEMGMSSGWVTPSLLFVLCDADAS